MGVSVSGNGIIEDLLDQYSGEPSELNLYQVIDSILVRMNQNAGFYARKREIYTGKKYLPDSAGGKAEALLLSRIIEDAFRKPELGELVVNPGTHDFRLTEDLIIMIMASRLTDSEKNHLFLRRGVPEETGCGGAAGWDAAVFGDMSDRSEIAMRCSRGFRRILDTAKKRGIHSLAMVSVPKLGDRFPAGYAADVLIATARDWIAHNRDFGMCVEFCCDEAEYGEFRKRLFDSENYSEEEPKKTETESQAEVTPESAPEPEEVLQAEEMPESASEPEEAQTEETAESVSEPEAQAEEIPERTMIEEPESEPGLQAEEIPESAAEPEKTLTEEPEPEPLPQAEEMPESIPEPEAELQAEEMPESTPEPEAELQAEEMPESIPEPEAELQAEAMPEKTLTEEPEPEPLLQAEEMPERTPEPEAELQAEEMPERTMSPEADLQTEEISVITPEPEPQTEEIPVIAPVPEPELQTEEITEEAPEEEPEEEEEYTIPPSVITYYPGDPEYGGFTSDAVYGFRMFDGFYDSVDEYVTKTREHIFKGRTPSESLWTKMRHQVTYRGMLEKFRQNPELLELLLSTELAVLVREPGPEAGGRYAPGERKRMDEEARLLMRARRELRIWYFSGEETAFREYSMNDPRMFWEMKPGEIVRVPGCREIVMPFAMLMAYYQPNRIHDAAEFIERAPTIRVMDAAMSRRKGNAVPEWREMLQRLSDAELFGTV